VAKFAKTPTTLINAHRLWTVKAAAAIVVLDRGRIASSGRHADLLQQRGLYADLAALQFESPGKAAGNSGPMFNGSGPP
jgi:ATP-binding cassette subfamily B protein